MKNFLSENKSKKLIYAVFALSFLIVLLGLFIASSVAEDREYSEAENRNLAGKPSVSVDSIFDGKLMADIESYFSDQFAFRDLAVGVKTSFSRLLGISTINGVYIGKEGRLYEVPSDYNENDINETVASINSFIGSCDIENKYFLLVPNSTEILPEHLPAFLECGSQADIINSIYKSADGNIICIDCVTPLKEHNNKEELYLRTDHHWTSAAAHSVFEEFAHVSGLDISNVKYETISLSNSFYGTLASSSGVYEIPDTLEAVIPLDTEGKYVVQNYSEKTKSSSVFDMASLKKKNQYEVFFGGNFSRIKISTKNANGKNLLIFKDSYANCLIPLLIPHYESIVIIDPRYFTGDIRDIVSDTDFSDVMFLYNLNTFLEDSVITDMFSVY